MSRLTDLRTIYRGMVAPLSWSVLAVLPEVPGRIRAARGIIVGLIVREEEAIERERVIDESYRVDMAYWHSTEPPKPWEEQSEYDTAVIAWREGEPVKPWREEAEYDAAMRYWRTQEPIRAWYTPTK